MNDNIEINEGMCIWNCSEYADVKFYQVMRLENDDLEFVTNVDFIDEKYDVNEWFSKASSQITELNNKLIKDLSENVLKSNSL